MNKNVFGIFLLFGLLVILRQTAAKSAYKSSSSYPEEEENGQLMKYSESAKPLASKDQDYEAEPTKKPYRTSPKSHNKKKRKLPSKRKGKFPSMYRGKKHKGREGSPKRHYNLGSRSGYRWMLYGSPLHRHYDYHHEYLHKRRSKSFWRRYAHHLARDAAFHPSHFPGRHGYGHGSREDERPIVVSIHPIFKAYNMRSASVLGYGLDSLVHDVLLASKLHGAGAKKALYATTKGKYKET